LFVQEMRSTIILKSGAPGVKEPTLERFASQAGGAVGLQGAITVLITSSQEMRRLNSRFRKKGYATDVLSFPAPLPGNGFAGDIAISLDIAARNARALGHSVADELRILILHGVLHLAGYDHESDLGEMAEKEQRLRRRLALPMGLIERASRKRKRKQPARSRV
jgi:probable rRNA maturation factor